MRVKMTGAILLVERGLKIDQNLRGVGGSLVRNRPLEDTERSRRDQQSINGDEQRRTLLEVGAADIRSVRLAPRLTWRREGADANAVATLVLIPASHPVAFGLLVKLDRALAGSATCCAARLGLLRRGGVGSGP